MDLSTALPTFVITLREGFEAALVVGIVLACLAKADKDYLNRWVYQGLGGGLVASVMVAGLLGGLFQGINTVQSPFTPVLKSLLASLFGLMALTLLSWMLLWMTQQAKGLKATVTSDIQAALSQQEAGQSIALVVFIAVLREGFEAVLFILAQGPDNWLGSSLGAVLGLGFATVLGYALFQIGLQINIKGFFQATGAFLVLIVAGLVIGILKNLDLAIHLLGQWDARYLSLCFAQDSCLLGPLIWNGSQILPDGQFPGLLLKALFGYRQQLYLVQILAYSLVLGGLGSLYFWQLQRVRLSSAPAKSGPPKIQSS
ncbi:FTR1 family protein [Synechocystis sp. LKSZ1]|uniref:FTR1 family iron permease n=1 Tax=Synechocystis sp. LKSZ1 TaxID=3144951 RepID=UPI00336C01DB